MKQPMVELGSHPAIERAGLVTLRLQVIGRDGGGPRGRVWWKSDGAVVNRTKVKRRKAHRPEMSWPTAAKSNFRRWAARSDDGLPRSSTFLPGEISRPPPQSAAVVAAEDERTRW